MDPKVAKKTRDTLGKVIQKPPLTEKLLGKPPFRFLHDVTTSVIKSTGFMTGLFTDSELNSENVKDKDSKIAFLQKAIDMVGLVTGKSLSVRPQKIVAGHEPEKTNEFLQVLAEAIKMKVDNDEYVRRVLKKGGGEEEKHPRSRSEDKKKKDSEEKKDRGKSREEKDRTKEREKSRDRERDKDRERSKDRDREGEKEKKDREKSRDRDREHRRKKYSEVVATPAKKESADSQSDKESMGDEKKPDANRVKVRRKHSSNRQEGSPSTDEKNAEEMRNLNPRLRADRPRGARRRSEKMLQPVKPGDESSDDDSSKDSEDDDSDSEERETVVVAAEVDKKRKTGTKSRLGVRIVESKKSKESNVEKNETPAEADTPSKPSKTDASASGGSKSASATPSKKSDTPSKKSDTPKAKSAPKSGGSTPKSEKTSSRRKSTDSRIKGDNSDVKRSGERRSSTNQAAPERRRKSSFTMMPDLKTQRDEAGKENESPDRDRIVNGDDNKETHSRPVRPTSAKGSRRRREGRRAVDSDEEDEEFLQKQEPSVGEADLPPQVANARRAARPSSARPAPPRPKQDGVESEPAMRLGTGRPANVIVDDGQQSEDEDENFIVEDSAPPPPEPDQLVVNKQDGDDDAEHGALVKKMLETKKEFEEGGQQQQTTGPPKKTEIERPAMSDAARRKKREVVQKEIDKLRTSIQSLTRSANPLGKIMDYVQEDLDSMQKELDKWKSENKDHSLALKRERGITDRSIEPLKAQLSDLDQAIKDQLDLIAATKSNIIRNDQKIDKMLKSVAKS